MVICLTPILTPFCDICSKNELDTRKEVTWICPWSVLVNVDTRVKHGVAVPGLGLAPGHPGLTHCFTRNAASLECSAGAPMPDTEEDFRKGKVFS